jgi:CheY-like chemotaxis protein
MKLAGKKILIVDDEDKLRRALDLWLRSQGAAVDQATNGAEAFRKATLAQPDLIVMDLMMPDVNGFEAIRSLRMLMKDKPIVVLTGYPTDENLEEATTSGANLCLAKPLDQPRFMQAVIELLSAPPPK